MARLHAQQALLTPLYATYVLPSAAALRPWLVFQQLCLLNDIGAHLRAAQCNKLAARHWPQHAVFAAAYGGQSWHSFSRQQLQVSACRRNKRQQSRRQAAATLQARAEPVSAGTQAMAEAGVSTMQSSAQAGAPQASQAPVLRGHEGALTYQAPHRLQTPVCASDDALGSLVASRLSCSSKSELSYLVSWPPYAREIA